MRSRRYISAALMMLGFLLQGSLQAQELINGVRHLGPGQASFDTNASFTFGLSRDSGASWITEASSSENVLVRATIHPDPSQLGQSGKLYLVIRHDNVFWMKNASETWERWFGGRVADLVPYRDSVTLSEDMNLDFFLGQVSQFTGEIRLFAGYEAADEVLRYNPRAHRITISTQTAQQQARALFESTISPNIMQARCITCHVAGGQAASFGAWTLARSSSAGYLDTNFAVLQGLTGSEVLLKSTGGDSHLGGVQLLSNSQEYQDLQSFYNLLEQ